MNSFVREISYNQWGRPSMHSKCFAFKKKVWVEGRVFFHSSLSYQCVPTTFPLSSQWIPIRFPIFPLSSQCALHNNTSHKTQPDFLVLSYSFIFIFQTFTFLEFIFSFSSFIFFFTSRLFPPFTSFILSSFFFLYHSL